ncbi:hypothetical protein CDAR_176661, partial [Caerostris darwini]
SAEYVFTNLGLHGMREDNAMETDENAMETDQNNESGADSPESTGHPSDVETITLYASSDNVYYYIQDFGVSESGSGGSSYDEDLIMIPISSATTTIDNLPSYHSSDGISTTEETIEKSNMQTPIV